MKAKYLPLGVVVTAIVFLTSCSAGKASVDEIKIHLQSSKEIGNCCFVQMNDGTIRNYSSIKLVTGVTRKPHLLADGKTIIYPNEIVAYQNSDHYAVAQKTFCCGRISNLAVETLPGFAVRVLKGKINVYRARFPSGSGVKDDFYVQMGTDGKIMAYSPGKMNELLKDNPEIAAVFNNTVEKNTFKKLHDVVEAMNADQALSSNR